MAPILSTLKPLIAGDVVFETKPSIHIILKHFKEIHCNYCLEKSVSLKKCSKCQQMYYCDKNCQTIDWKYHKNECKHFRDKMLKLEECFDEELLFTRLWLSVKSDPKFASKRHQLSDGMDVRLIDIEVDYLRFGFDFRTHDRFQRISKLFNGLEIKFNVEELLHWFLIFKSIPLIPIQCFQPFGEKSLGFPPIKLGFGFCPQFSAVSHSCLPNAAIVINGLSLQLRAIKPIAVGTDVTISYVCLAQNKADRRISLKTLFSIKCKCLKCEKNLDSNIDYQKFKNFCDSLKGKAKQLMSRKDPKVSDDWNELQSMSEQMFIVAKEIFGEYSPDRTGLLLYWIITSINVKTIERPSLNISRKLCEELKRIFDVSHGEEHPFRPELESLLNYCSNFC